VVPTPGLSSIRSAISVGMVADNVSSISRPKFLISVISKFLV
jgi:hypothetical protein